MKSFVIAAAIVAIAATALTGIAHAEDSARYQVRFDVNWTAQTHSYDYPSNAHFSGMVGATHDGTYQFMKDGAIASPGLKALSEKGAHSPLDDEITAAIQKGNAGALFESAPLFEFPGTMSAQFKADAAHPYVSVAAMIAPSPDWFTGVSQIKLRKADGWADEIKLTLFAWDAGTDNGTKHGAADDEANPRQSIRLIASRQFMTNDGLKPLGTVTFTRLRDSASK